MHTWHMFNAHWVCSVDRPLLPLLYKLVIIYTGQSRQLLTFMVVCTPWRCCCLVWSQIMHSRRVLIDRKIDKIQIIAEVSLDISYLTIVRYLGMAMVKTEGAEYPTSYLTSHGSYKFKTLTGGTSQCEEWASRVWSCEIEHVCSRAMLYNSPLWPFICLMRPNIFIMRSAVRNSGYDYICWGTYVPRRAHPSQLCHSKIMNII